MGICSRNPEVVFKFGINNKSYMVNITEAAEQLACAILCGRTVVKIRHRLFKFIKVE